METNKKEILLVPYDFTEVADCAVNHAIGMAEILNLPVSLFHVIGKDTKDSEKDNIRKKLSDICTKFQSQTQAQVDYITKEGSIFSDIANAAELMNAKFVLMGTHGKKGFQHITGSYAMKVITKANMPFIVVQNKPFKKDGYNNIVITVDDSPESKQKIKWAVNIAQLFNSTIHIFYPNDSDEFVGGHIKRNVSQIKTVFEKNSIKFIDAQSTEKGGNFAKQVIAYSEKNNANLIVIMTNPDQLLPNFVLGKWDEQILFNTAEIPVMCINPRDLHIMIIGL
ncbi:MAG: universal stress protein [Bacteroidales bacterium]|nr:universal stress protein [Bacteroidales bacterium]